MKNEQLFLFLKHFLSKLNITIDPKELRFQLLSHPYYPSLNSLVGVLNHFGIENYPIQVDENLENLSSLPIRFITKTKENSAFVMVTKREGAINLTYEDFTSKKLTEQEFLKIWDGKLLIVEAPAREIGLASGTRLSLIISALGVSVLLGLVFWNLNGLLERLHLLLALSGLFVGVLILNKRFGGMSSLLDKVCHFTSKNDCDKVINSTEISLPFNLELGDLAVTYFAAHVVSWIVSAASGIDISLLFYLAILTIPITLFSLYYQKYVVRSWCTLCLAIVGTLWLQLGVFALDGNLWNFTGLPDSRSVLVFVFTFT